MGDLFRRFADKASHVAVSRGALVLLVLTLALWLVAGDSSWLSRTWRIAVNTGLPIMTLLLLVWLQRKHRRETAVIHRSLIG